MTEFQNFSAEQQLKELMEKNLALTQEIYQISLKIKKHLFWQKVTSIIYIIIIVLPLILSIIYLPKIINTSLSGILPPDVNQGNLLKDLYQNRDKYINTLK
jgi:hypothetical protein